MAEEPMPEHHQETAIAMGSGKANVTTSFNDIFCVTKSEISLAPGVKSSLAPFLDGYNQSDQRPVDWNDPKKHHRIMIALQKALDIFVDKTGHVRDKYGNPLCYNVASLNWDLDPNSQESIVAMILHYLTSEE